MVQVQIRQSGGASIISLPKALLQSLGLGVGSQLDIAVEDNRIVLKESNSLTLEDLLATSPPECFRPTEEDADWLNAPPVGKEIL